MDIRSLLILPVIMSSLCIQNTFAALTQNEAENRSKQVHSIEYKVHLDLSESDYNSAEDNKDIPKLPLY